MVASVGQDPPAHHQAQRVNSSLVSPWPKQFDMEHDIIEPGKSDTYKSELVAALRSRDLWNTVLDVPPTLESITEENPGADSHDILAAYDAIMKRRQIDSGIMAANIPQTVKMSSLSLTDQTKLRTLQTAGDGLNMFDFVWKRLDLSQGEPQDKVRQKYMQVKVSPTDSVATIRKKVDLKWWLFKQHTLYDSTNAQREGIRELNVMLLGGPHVIKLGAIAAIANMSESVTVDGDKWVAEWQSTHERYGELMVSQGGAYADDGGGLMLATNRNQNGSLTAEFREQMDKTNTCAANGGNDGLGCKIWNCEGKKNAGGDCILRTEQPLTGVFSKGSQAIANGRNEYKANPKPETALNYVPHGNKMQAKKPSTTSAPPNGAGYWVFPSEKHNDAGTMEPHYDPLDPRSHDLYDSDQDSWDDDTIGADTLGPPQQGFNLMMAGAGTGAGGVPIASPLGSRRTPVVVKPRTPAGTPPPPASPISPEAIAAAVAAAMAARTPAVEPIPIDSAVAPTPPVRDAPSGVAPREARATVAQIAPPARVTKRSWLIPLIIGTVIGMGLDTVRTALVTSKIAEWDWHPAGGAAQSLTNAAGSSQYASHSNGGGHRSTTRTADARHGTTCQRRRRR